jgi:hypothetical protein
MLRSQLFFLFFVITLGAAAQQKPNTLSRDERKEGWMLLFDGKSTNGWHKYGGKPVGAAWKVEDGMLLLDPTQKNDWQVLDGGDIVTDKSFKNFHLKLEWKIAQNGNSGIMFYIHEDTAKYKWPWMSAPEMQVLDNNGHADSKIIKHRAGDLYDLLSCKEETVRPHGQWNQVEIRCVDGQLDFWLNGVNVVATQLWGENWRRLIAGSKFAKMSGFGTYQQGKIGLQDHGDLVWFRNIKVRAL